MHSHILHWCSFNVTYHIDGKAWVTKPKPWTESLRLYSGLKIELGNALKPIPLTSARHSTRSMLCCTEAWCRPFSHLYMHKSETNKRGMLGLFCSQSLYYNTIFMWFILQDGAHYMIYTPSDPLLFVAVKVLSDNNFHTFGKSFSVIFL